MPYRKATIRPYRPEDESLLFLLAREAFGDQAAWSDEAALGATGTDTVFVAELDGEPAGYVALVQEARTLRIEHLLVSPRHEHEGVGRQLLDYAEGYAISCRATALQVVVEATNRRALDLYRRRGFVAIGADVYELSLPTG